MSKDLVVDELTPVRSELLSSKEMAALGCGWKISLNPFRSVRKRILKATEGRPVLRSRALWTAKIGLYEDKPFSLTPFIFAGSIFSIILMINSQWINIDFRVMFALSSMALLVSSMLLMVASLLLRKHRLDRIASPPPMRLPDGSTGCAELDTLIALGAFEAGHALLAGGMTPDEIQEIGSLARAMALIPGGEHLSVNGLLETTVEHRITAPGRALISRALKANESQSLVGSNVTPETPTSRGDDILSVLGHAGVELRLPEEHARV